MVAFLREPPTSGPRVIRLFVVVVAHIRIAECRGA
jgi:hypothetical protein